MSSKKAVEARERAKNFSKKGAFLDVAADKALLNQVMDALPESVGHLKKQAKQIGYINEQDEVILPDGADRNKCLQEWKGQTLA